MSPETLRQRARRFNLSHRRLTRRRLDAFAAAYATGGPVLLVACGDLDGSRLFPAATTIDAEAIEDLGRVAAGSFPLVVCTGLLEHVPDPQALVGALHRVVAPGGRLLLSASAVFPFHGGSDNYFHFTPSGLRLLLGGFEELERLEGSTGPFETVGVLLQRINLQCDLFPPLRLALEVAMRVVPLLDGLVHRQYLKITRRDNSTDAGGVGVMPATLHAVARKAAADPPRTAAPERS